MDDAWKFETVDLTGCDREPIHISGAIQPHGVLLAMDRRDFAIRQWAGDTPVRRTSAFANPGPVEERQDQDRAVHPARAHIAQRTFAA
jgi:hypothetical protein